MAIDLKELGSRLRRIRESRSYTQEEIAELLGIPQVERRSNRVRKQVSRQPRINEVVRRTWL